MKVIVVLLIRFIIITIAAAPWIPLGVFVESWVNVSPPVLLSRKASKSKTRIRQNIVPDHVHTKSNYRYYSNNKKSDPRMMMTSSDTSKEHDFEEWFHQYQEKGRSRSTSTNCDALVQHAYFGSLRGLRMKPTVTTDAAYNTNNQVSVVLKVPRSMVLQTSIPMKQSKATTTTTINDWDSQLAQQLWRKCSFDDDNTMNGYCTFLSGQSQYPVVAPNALRHWTNAQREYLQNHFILELQSQQQLEWQRKYQQQHQQECGTMEMTWDQFQWCMEVVHSRAFCGSFGMTATTNQMMKWATIAIPTTTLLAAVVGGNAFLNGNDELGVMALLGIAMVSSILLMVNQKQQEQKEAVLLPFIDSANHLDDADSLIEYDPITQAFTLTIGPKCVLDNQVYVSYGKKSDIEWLLNYGFLPGVNCYDNNQDEDAQRKQLAEEFLRRQNTGGKLSTL